MKRHFKTAYRKLGQASASLNPRRHFMLVAVAQDNGHPGYDSKSVQRSPANSALMVPIYENYKGYRPPGYAHATVTKLLSKLPQQYLSGLQSVVLTNRAAIGRRETVRFRGKKYARRQCSGFYHPKLGGEQPWIEIIVDAVVDDWFGPNIPRFMPHVSVLRNLAFASTLFHEVGHHLEHTIGAPAPRGEAAAEAWTKRLLRSYFRKCYWYLVPFLGIAKAIVARLGRRMFRRARLQGKN